MATHLHIYTMHKHAYTHTHAHAHTVSHGSWCEDEGSDVESLLPHCEFLHTALNLYTHLSTWVIVSQVRKFYSSESVTSIKTVCLQGEITSYPSCGESYIMNENRPTSSLVTKSLWHSWHAVQKFCITSKEHSRRACKPLLPNVVVPEVQLCTWAQWQYKLWNELNSQITIQELGGRVLAWSSTVTT